MTRSIPRWLVPLTLGVSVIALAANPLVDAAYRDDFPAARQLIAEGADVSATNRFGVSALSQACLNGNAELVELLLESGANPDFPLRGGETPLMIAARTGRTEPVRLLLARGANVNPRERRGQTAVMWAAAEGHTEVVKLLIGAGAEFREPLESSGFTPLTFAVREGRMETALALIRAGADANEAMEPKRPNGRSVRRGTTPFILAVENGHFELALKLVELGANPKDERTGMTALHILTRVRKPNSGDGDDDLPPPDGSGEVSSLEFVRQLVARGAEVNARLKRGSSGKGQVGRAGATPFLLACATGDVPLMRLLVELGADPLLPNNENTTPLIAAAGLGVLAPGEEAGTEEEAIEAVKLALELGNDINAVDNNGETVMHGAAYKGAPRLIRLLAERGAKIEVWNRPNKWGWSPTTIAEGYRPGNFRPLAYTLEALHEVMRAGGVTPPPLLGKRTGQAGDKQDWAEPD